MNHTVPKRKVPVRIHLMTGERLTGNVFLDYIDVIHRGEQTLLDKMNDESRWFPLQAEGAPVEIVNRSRVVLAEPAAGVGPELVRRESSPVFRQEQVTVQLTGERSLTGGIAMDLPDEFSRVSDFLNFPQNFFAVETGDGPVLVSKEHVVRLTPHERPPALPDSTSPIEERA